VWSVIKNRKTLTFLPVAGVKTPPYIRQTAGAGRFCSAIM
jgi:hypothetical protein